MDNRLLVGFIGCCVFGLFAFCVGVVLLICGWWIYLLMLVHFVVVVGLVLF